jgi:hypothetical protein
MKHGVVYRGVRGSSGKCLVTCDGAELMTRNELRNHSPTGFEWGFNGSGPAQLALAMLCDFFRDDNKALEYYEEFKTDVIAPIGGATWIIKSETIVEWARHKMKERKSASKGPVY